VKGSVYKRCSCRHPGTKKPLGAQCPDLRKPRHGAWYYRVDMPALPGEARRRPEYGPFDKKTDAEGDLAKVVGRNARVADRKLLVRTFLENWLAGMKLKLKPKSYASYEEACRLYFIPAWGHLRLVELRDYHLQALVAMMMKINRELDGTESPEELELLRRLLAVRADDPRRPLPSGKGHYKKSAKPLSPERIERIFAVLSSAATTAIETHKITDSPLVGVVLPAPDHPKPLPWTPQREARFREELRKRVAAAEEDAQATGRVLTTVEREALWTSPGLCPVPSMVWMPAHAGRFLDYLDETGERLAPLYAVTMFAGFRRDEVLGLAWTEADLDEGTATVRETQSGSGPKSDAGKRIVPLSAEAVEVLRAWRKRQAAERLAWGPDWADDRGLIFTREDGMALVGQTVSRRFETLAFRAGLPPVRFHDLRHGTASLMKAARVDTKYISAALGHARTSFTDSQYVSLFPDVQKAAADAASAIVPRKRRATGAGGA
jgi:integrase